MISHDFVEYHINEIKTKINDELARGNNNHALELISLAASILYKTNIYYMDRDLEHFIKCISNKIVPIAEVYHPEENVVLFWDGFGLNNRGLVQIYLKALCCCRKVLYVTFDKRKEYIPDVLNILSNSGGKALFITHDKLCHMIEQLNVILQKYKPAHFFFYSYPDDVIATSIMYAYEGKLKRYQINLTDHAFWLGAGCIDTCIEFREYGANISVDYREIPEGKITYLPYYPIYDEEQKFEGYPFPYDASKQQIIFSGGGLYKTIGEGNTYYKIVEYILSNYKNIVFWYAGSGDTSQIDKIIAKYPGRAFLTAERKDLFQILLRCRFYLNTYPMVGGLMMQYAAIAAKVPVTLRHNNDGSGILISQDKLKIEFDDIGELKQEIDRLMLDEDYLHIRSEQMKESVISAERFNHAVEELLNHGKTGLSLCFGHEDTTEFRNTYLLRMDKDNFYELYAKRNLTIGRAFPYKFFRGCVHKGFMRIKRIRKKLVNLWL